MFVSSVVHRVARSVCALLGTCMNQWEIQAGQPTGSGQVMQYTSLTQIFRQGPLDVTKEDNQTFQKSRIYSFFPHY